MRIASQKQGIESAESKAVQNLKVDAVLKKENEDSSIITNLEKKSLENNEITGEKLQQAVESMNELLDINNNTAKFVFHEGLDRYFIQVVNRETEEVVKEIPPEKLLNAFYEMQKLVGMIVDEKI